MSEHDQDLQAYYALGKERARLQNGHGRLEFERTIEIITRYLPSPPRRVADIGGGPGRYALWLAERGYAVEHRDLVELHVAQLRAATGAGDRITSELGDARQLDLESGSVDAVLLLGPLYHLRERNDRLSALREVARVLAPEGVVFAAAISRWAVRLDNVLHLRGYRERPGVGSLIDAAETDGGFAPFEPAGFTACLHRPDELRDEIGEAGLRLRALVGVEGPAGFLPDIAERMADDADRQALLDAARALESVPEVIGANPHLLAVATRPA